MIRDWLVPVLWLLPFVAVGLWITDGFIGWRPRFGMEAHFQQVIREANVAEVFRGSAGRQIDDVTDAICDRVSPGVLNGMGIPVDDRKVWPLAIGGEEKPMDIWKVYQDKGWISACNDGIRHLQIAIDRETAVCTAQVKLWHLGCYP